MSLPLTELVENTFERTTLSEQDITSYEKQLFQPSQHDLTDASNFDINVNLSGSDLIANYPEAEILVNWRLIKSDGVAYAAAYNAADAGTILATGVPAGTLVNSAWSLFKSLRIELNGEVFDEINYPGQAFNVLAKASKSIDWMNQHGPDMYYYPALDAVNDTDLNYLKGARRSDTAFRAGYVWSKLRLSDVLGSANMKKLFPQCNFTFRLTKDTAYAGLVYRGATTDLHGHASLNIDCATQIKHVRLYVPCLKVKDRLMNSIMSKSVLENKAIPLDWMQISYAKLRVVQVANQLSTVPLFSAVRNVRYLFICPQLEGVTTSQDGGNKSVYVSNGVSQLFVTVNGRQFPFLQLTPTALGYQDAVSSLYKAFNKEDSSLTVNTLNFATLHSLYFIDISKVDSLFSENGESPLIQVNFASADNGAVNLHCIYLAERHHALTFLGNSMKISSVAK